MDSQELGLVRQVLGLSNRILEDKQEERDASTRKSFYQTLVTAVIVICFSALWFYEIHQSYNYSEFEVKNSATAVVECKGGVNDGEN